MQIWLLQGTSPTGSRMWQVTNFENSQYFSDYYMENGSFMKLDNLSVGYNFNNLIQDKIKLRVYATAQNLFHSYQIHRS